MSGTSSTRGRAASLAPGAGVAAAKVGRAAFNGANSIPANYISIPLRDRCSKHARQRPTEFLAD